MEQDSKGPESKVDIVREVASALEEEEFGKDSPEQKAKTATNPQQQEKTTKPFESASLSSTYSTVTSSIKSQEQQKMLRPLEPVPTKSGENSNISSSGSSTSTWQQAPDNTSVKSESVVETGGMWGWMSNAVSASLQTTSSIGRNLVEKTKSSVDTVITTLDPAMEDYLHDRGQAVNLILTTEDPAAVEAVRDGFRQIFELAFVTSCSSVSSIAPLPVGCSAGMKGAQHRVSHLRRTKKVQDDKVLLGMEEFVAELVPGKWFSMICLHLSDPILKAEFHTLSQAVEIPKQYITKAEQSTPSNYNLRWSGLSFTLAEVILGSGHTHGDWQSLLGGCSRKQILTVAARTLAGQYRNKLNETAESVMDKAIVL